MPLFGMDPAEVRRIGTEARSAADNIGQVISKVTSTVSGSQWVGPDREAFMSNWNDVSARKLNEVKSFLEAFATEAEIQAKQQEDTSSPGATIV